MDDTGDEPADLCPNQDHSTSGLSIGAMLGIGIGGILVLAFVGYCIKMQCCGAKTGDGGANERSDSYSERVEDAKKTVRD